MKSKKAITLPSAIDAEEYVLGCFMIDNTSFRLVEDRLHRDVFYSQKHQAVFDAIKALSSEQKPTEMMSVVQQLKKDGMLEFVDGPFFISQLTDRIGQTTQVEHFTAILLEKYIARELIKRSNEISRKASDESNDVFELLNDAEEGIKDISSGVSGEKEASVVDILKEIDEDVSRAIESDEDIIGVPSGLRDVDAVTLGWRKTDFIVLAARPGMGKAIPVDETVKTPDGDKRIGDIKIGDPICGTDGNVYSVTGVFPQGERQMYKITFDDGMTVEADGDHLWEVQDRAIRKTAKSDKIRVVKTTDMIEEGLFKGNGKRRNFSMKFPKPVFHNKKELPIDPYVLGTLIGDGCMADGKSIGFTNSEEDIIDKLKEYLGDYFTEESRNDNRKNQYRVNKCFLHDEINKMGLMGKLSYEKFIPSQYMTSSIEDRLNLLRGLVDTDGYAGNKNCIEYSTTSKKLSKQVISLARSLGGRATVKSRMGSYTKNGEVIETRLNYRVYLSFGEDVVPFSSKKHKSVWVGKKQFHKRFVDKIEKSKKKEAICISVDSPDSCFLMNDYVVTHNTQLMLQYVKAALKDNLKVAVASLEMSNKQLVKRMISSTHGVSGRDLDLGRVNMKTWHQDLGKIQTKGLYLWDKPSMHVDTLRNKVRRKKIQSGVDIVLVDYLQLLTGKGGNREQEISYIARTLKGIAKECDVPVIALSQLSRSVEQRADRRPLLSDLRESGAIEQDADIVSFLYRPQYYSLPEWEDGTPCQGQAEIIISKHRNGELKDVRVGFELSKGKFYDLGKKYESNGNIHDHQPYKTLSPNTEFEMGDEDINF